MIDVEEAYWLIPNNILINMLKTDPNGLSSIEASFRLSKFGNNRLDTKRRKNFLSLFLSQFKSPIIIIFVFTALLSFFLGEREDALIFAIILISSSLGFWQEKTASDVIHKLISTVKTKSKVLRDGKIKDIVSENIVSGDIIILESGDKVPADCKIFESKDIFVNEATLTGETYPIEKSDIAILNKDVPLRKRLNSLFMGSFVISGTAKALVIHTGANTEIGKISSRLNYKQDTEFQKGIKQLGYFLVEITLLLVISIFLINVYLGRPVLESFLFPLALAIGLTPQLLPTIISINLSHGARRMANEKVIVKRPESIENLGSMDILCTDKTGTITTGELKLYSYSDINGHNNEKILLYAYLNAMYETGYANPIDKAIKEYKNLDNSNYSKFDEIPYDFIRKRLSIAVSKTENTSQNKRNQSMIITKGALQNILDICSFVEIDNEKVEHISLYYQKIIDTFKDLGNQGFRVLGIAHKIINENSYSVVVDKDDETDMIFLGFLIFFDPIKSEVPDSLNKLHNLGVSVKIITGDNRHVAKHVAQKIGLTNTEIVIGEEVHHMSSTVLAHKVTFVDIFAEIEPNQKEQIILALRKAGYGVGYIGDGINDAPALHAADASISVDTAADVVKEAADIVLLEKYLKVIVKGIEEGRKTFSNTLKYIFMATSANFGNMFSMAGASSFLSFLPLLPKQVLLLNLVTDIPEMAIATDNVDKEMIQKPRKMNIKFIRKFMLYFGLLSTLFDFITFGILIVLNASIAEFRTIWFMESLISASLIILIIRTKSVFYKSRPSKYLIISIFSIMGIIIVIPYTIIGKLFGFVSPPLIYLPIIGIIVFTYICMTEVVKKIFYKNYY